MYKGVGRNKVALTFIKDITQQIINLVLNHCVQLAGIKVRYPQYHAMSKHNLTVKINYYDIKSAASQPLRRLNLLLATTL